MNLIIKISALYLKSLRLYSRKADLPSDAEAMVICGKSAKILKNSYIMQEKTDYNNIYVLTYRKSLCYNKLSYNQGGIYEQRGIY